MKITTKSLISDVGDKGRALYKYTAKDNKYIMIAITTTTRRFGPSGSLKNKNITLEHTKDVAPNMSSGVFLNLKYIVAHSL